MNRASEYRRLRAKGWHAQEAFRAAKVAVAFACLERDGLVKFEVIDDDDSYDLSYVNTWRIGRGQELRSERERDEVKREIQRRLAVHGHCGIAVSFRRGPGCAWEPVDSVWGFIGDDVFDNGYDTDLKRAAIDAVRTSTVLGTVAP